VTRLEAAQPQPGSVEAEFLATLQAPDPVAVVRSRVTAYRNRIEQNLAEDADPGIRDAELKRLFDLLIERRKTLVNLPEFRNLKESKALLPLPPQN
jgi:hypothetical protein